VEQRVLVVDQRYLPFLAVVQLIFELVGKHSTIALWSQVVVEVQVEIVAPDKQVAAADIQVA
jgi:hypothetical protein